MQGNPKVIELLQKAARLELAAVNQYKTHFALQKGGGFSKIAKRLTLEHAEDEERHMKLFMKRIVFFGGVPDISFMPQVNVGFVVPDQFENDLKSEIEAIMMYQEAAKTANDLGDLGTRHLFEKIMREEEDHADDFETQLSLINTVGLQNYLARHSHVEVN